MMRNDSPDPEMERRLRDHFAEEAEDLRAPDDLWDRLESQLGEQRPPRFRLLRGGALTLREHPWYSAAAAALLVVAIGIATADAPDDGGALSRDRFMAPEATSPSRTTTTTTAASMSAGDDEDATAESADAEIATTKTQLFHRALPVPTGTPEAWSTGSSAQPAPEATAAPTTAGHTDEGVDDDGISDNTLYIMADEDDDSAPTPPADSSGRGGDVAPRAPEQPPATTFRDYERTGFVQTSVDAISTFSLDTDRTSYFLALNWARNGYTVEPDSVRAEEWINAFDYGYAHPIDGRSFAITGDVVRHPLDADLHLARIAFQAPEFRDDTPLNVTLVLDASGSMSAGNRVDIARAAAEAIRASLASDDRIAVVHFTTDVIDEYTVEHSVPDHEEVVWSISRLAAHDNTNVQAGLDLGVQLADQARRERPGAFNYIILMSDGVANVDATDPFAILESAEDTDSRNPLRLITIGVGIENYNDYLLEQLAQHGNGWYRYLDDTEQARETFTRENWVALSTPFADQTRAQVRWNPTAVKSWRIVGYENRVTPDHTFAQDRKEFAEIPAGTATTVFYELELHDRSSLPREFGSVEVRWVGPVTGESRSQSSAVTDLTGVPFDARGDLLRLGAIVGLAADRYSRLSTQVEGQQVDAAGVRADLAALQGELDALSARLGSTEAYRDFDFLLDALIEAAGQLAPDSGYSR